MSKDPKYSLKGKVIWLSGASSGIGEALAHRLAEIECKLILSARRLEVLEDLATSLSTSKTSVLPLACDVTDPEEVKSTIEIIEKHFGPVDVLIANAGTHIPTDVTNFNVKEYEGLFNVNFFGALNCIEAVLPKMISRNKGHLVAVSSVAGYQGLPKAAAYGASKAALSHFMESLRFDLNKFNIEVTVVNPGFVKTPLTDKNDFKMPFLITAEKAAENIVNGIEQGKFEIAFPTIFVLILKFLRLLPSSLYHRLILSKVVKN